MFTEQSRESYLVLCKRKGFIGITKIEEKKEDERYNKTVIFVVAFKAQNELKVYSIIGLSL